MNKCRPYPQVIISRKAGLSLASGHPWVFEGEVRAMHPSPIDAHPAVNGEAVDIFEEGGAWRGIGLLSEKSKIRVRVITRNTNDRIDEAFWKRKIIWAWNYRKTVMSHRTLMGYEPDTNCCRILFSEADGFPGLTVDRYEETLVTQVGTVGMEKLRPILYPLLLQILQKDGEKVNAIYERNDGPNRVKEGLDLYKGWWPNIGENPSSKPTHCSVQENGLRYDIDLEKSQKTGFFLDQKYNRRAVRDLAEGRRVLDCFCHVGPFGLNAMAGKASFVREVDINETAIELARRNARLNGFLSDQEQENSHIAFSCANVMEYLPKLTHDKALLSQQGGPFDLIVLDPPAFTKSRSTISRALKGYREINCAALRLLPRGGYLATCSCSRFMTRNLFIRAIGEAAHDANVTLRQIEERQQAPDHPIIWGIPETHYLDFFIFQIV